MQSSIPNGSITPKTKIPLSLVGGLLVAVAAMTAAWVRVEFKLDSIEATLDRSLGDRFRGTDADRWRERWQVELDEHARTTNSDSISAPGWRAK